MRYALVENGVVVNIIELAAKNAQEFPNAVLAEDYDLAIEDTYDAEEGKFYHEGVQLLNKDEKIEILHQALSDLLGEYVDIDNLDY